MNSSIFLRPPVRTVDGIPVFSETDGYVENYDKIATDHLDHLTKTNLSPFMVEDQIRQSEKVTLSFVHRHLAAGTKILDAGVGTGALLKHLANYDLFGVDIALGYLKEAQKHGIKVAMAKLAELPYVDHYFDGIVVADVLEHLIDLDASVAQLVRVLKPGGIILVRVPNREDLSSYVADEKYEFAHVRDFDENSLRLYFEKCFGFEFIESGYCANSFYVASQLRNPAPRLNAQIRRILPGLETAYGNDSSCASALRCLSSGLTWSLEEQVDALILLRDRYPKAFGELAEVMLHPAELLGVFRAGWHQ